MTHAASIARTLATFAGGDTAAADATQAARATTGTAVMIAIEEIPAIVEMIVLERTIAIGIAIEIVAMIETGAAPGEGDTTRATTVARSPPISEAAGGPLRSIAAMRGTGKERTKGRARKGESEEPLDRTPNLNESNRSLIRLTVEAQEPAPKELSQEPKEQAD